jgi:hypothetical protein
MRQKNLHSAAQNMLVAHVIHNQILVPGEGRRRDSQTYNIKKLP